MNHALTTPGSVKQLARNRGFGTVTSPTPVWPLRDHAGRTWAERKAMEAGK